MTLFRTVLVSSGLVLAFFSGAAQAQQNAGAAGKMVTLQMPAIPDPAVEPVLAALMRAGGDRFRGIRNGAAWDADTSLLNPANPAPPGLLGDKTFREGFAALGRLGLSFDALVLHPQLNDVANLAAAFPDTKIVLNHVGRLVGVGAYAGRLSEQFPRWAASMKALAAHENVYVKVGGLGQAVNGLGFEKLAEPPSSEMVADAMPSG